MNVLDQIEAPSRRPPVVLPSDLLERLRAFAALFALGAIVVTATILAIDSAQHFSSVVANSWKAFPGWVRGPFADLPGSLLSSGTYSELTFGMTFAWVVALLYAPRLGLKPVVAAIVFLHVVFLLTPPLASTDIWNYIGYSHLGVLHGLSPYAHAPIARTHDPSFAWVTWPHLKTPYGPLFTMSTYAIAPLGMAGGLWTLKAVMAGAALGVVYLVYRLALRLGFAPVPALVLVGLSPAWLIWLVGGSHNDVLMMLAALGAISLTLSRRYAWAGFLVVIAAGFKAPAIVLLPFLVIAAADRRAMLRGVAAGAATLVAATLIAFHSLQPLAAFQEQSGYYTNRSVVGELFRLFGAPGATPYAQWPLTVLFAVACVALLRWAWRGADPLRAAGWAFAGLLAVTLWEFPWYVAWVLPFAALTADRRLKIASLTIMIVLLVAYVPPYLFLT